jgi:outer membrane protein assembly factor BamB
VTEVLNFQVGTYKIYDVKFDNWMKDVNDKWVYDDFINDESYKKYWISLTSLAHHKKSNSIYIGIGSFSNELLWKFDRETKKIESLGYEKFADKYDAKFHRSLEVDGDTIYAASALFHDVDKQFEAKGGRLVSYDITTNKFRLLAIPIDRVYIQSIALDKKSKVIYGFGASPEVFWSYDLKENKSKFIAHIGSGAEFAQAHNPVIDDDGKVWGTYGILRAFAYDVGPDSTRLFCYDPKKDSMEFFKYGLPKDDYDDKARPDTSLNGGDGYIYFGTEAGTLARLNPKSGEVKKLCKPTTSKRLAGLVRNEKDGLLYGACGEDYQVQLFAYDTEKEKLVDMKPIINNETRERPVRIHHMVITDDGVIYAGENDNRDRPGYLWECILD